MRSNVRSRTIFETGTDSAKPCERCNERIFYFRAEPLIQCPDANNVRARCMSCGHETSFTALAVTHNNPPYASYLRACFDTARGFHACDGCGERAARRDECFCDDCKSRVSR